MKGPVLQIIALVLSLIAGVWTVFSDKFKLMTATSFIGLAVAFLAVAELLKSCTPGTN
jgi:type IV secretory pathway VirB2 component (pilin)